MRLALEHELALIIEVQPKSGQYRSDMLAHPSAGRSLRNYALLTDSPNVAMALGLSDAERFWSRYYWLARFAREWQAIAGHDAGLQQQVFQLLESAESSGIAYDALSEIDAAVSRDTVVRPPE